MSINLDIKLKRADKVYSEGVSNVKTYMYQRNSTPQNLNFRRPSVES